MTKIAVRCACGKTARVVEIRSNARSPLGFPPVRYICDVCWRREQRAQGQIVPWKQEDTQE